MSASPTTAPPRSGPLVTVAIVAFDSGAYLQACVDALARQTFGDFEAVIADNASADGSVARLALPDGRFRVLAMGENAGFAAANNRVAQGSAAEFLATLNPDAEAEPGWLQALVAAARARPEVAAFGSLQLSLDAPGRLEGVGDVWHLAGLAWRAGEGWDAARAPGDGEILGPCAAAALYRREAFVRLGGFDERFFCYCEDVDLALRLRREGGTARRVSSAVVRHAGSGVSGRHSDFTLFHGHRNRVWAFLKNTTGPWFWLLLPYHLAFDALYMALAIRRGFGRPIWRAYAAAWRGRRPFLAERRRGGGFGRVLAAAAWSPLSPWSRELRPRL